MLGRAYVCGPPIAEKCWTDDDLEFWKSGNYDMTEQSPEVQIMLDLASMLIDAKVEWLLAESRANSVRQDGPGVASPSTVRVYRGARRRGANRCDA